ncbi:MAG TPA: hypothetical protein VJB92_03310 [Candidatus Paceibacterota bacterium]
MPTQQPGARLPAIGQRIKAIKQLTWTIGEFEDFPLIVEPGDQGIVVGIDYSNRNIDIEWDKDEQKHLRKCVILDSDQRQWPIRPI